MIFFSIHCIFKYKIICNFIRAFDKFHTLNVTFIMIMSIFKFFYTGYDLSKYKMFYIYVEFLVHIYFWQVECQYTFWLSSILYNCLSSLLPRRNMFLNTDILLFYFLLPTWLRYCKTNKLSYWIKTTITNKCEYPETYQNNWPNRIKKIIKSGWKKVSDGGNIITDCWYIYIYCRVRKICSIKNK